MNPRSPLGTLCELVKGTSPISKTLPGSYPLVTTGEEHKTADSYQFDAEAVCIPLISSTGHGHASLKRVHYQEGQFALANLLVAALVRDRKLLSPRFLAAYLNYYKDRLIVPLMTGAANMSISIKSLETVPVELPPIAEQYKIMERLDELTEVRMLSHEADRLSNEFIPALFHSMFQANEHTYPRATLAEAIERFIDYRGRTPEKSSSGVSLVTAKVVKGGRVLPPTEFIPEETYDAWMTRGLPERGDVLFTTEAPLGEVALVEETRIALAQRVLLLRPKRTILDSLYLLTALKMPLVWRQIEDRATGTTVRGIRQSELRKVEIPLPPLPSQKAFSAIVADFQSLRACQQESRHRLLQLQQAVLHRAFENKGGELAGHLNGAATPDER